MKQKILKELEKKELPNLKFLYSKKVLEIALEILEDLLQEEKENFYKKLKIENKNINFDLFIEDSKLDFFWSLINHLDNTNSNSKTREIIEKFEAKLTEFSNEIEYSKRYFEMLEYCFKNCKLNTEQEKIIKDAIKHYKIRWINLLPEKQEELKNINLELSKLSTKFSNNVLDSEKEFIYFLKDDKYLKEFPKSDLENAKNLSKEKKKKWYAFDSSHSNYLAIMKYCSSSKVRKDFYIAHSSFASSWKYDNREIILKIIELKNKKAKILWYKNYAELSLEFKMAESPKQVIDLLSDLAQKAKKKAQKEIEEIKVYFNLKELNAWDFTYYSRKLKEEKYKLDDKKLKEYFEFENTKKALFKTVEKLYWIEMKPYSNSFPIWDEIEAYEVYKNWKFISYFIADYFYNPNKRSGAWANELRSKFKDKKAIVVNVMNFKKSKDWKTLLTLSEVETLFHEFGHAIHWMLSRSQYSELSWYWVEWDFVELPSQLLEKWCNNKLTIKNISKHYKTWEKIPDNLVQSLEKLKFFWMWNFVLNQSIFALLDMKYFSWILFNNEKELDNFSLDYINELSIFKKDKNYKMYCSFSHIFDWAYSAWYYSYLWADIIVDDIWAEFKKNWVFDKKTAQRFEEKILWAWSIKKANEMFKDFMWRNVSINAFLEEKWLNI